MQVIVVQHRPESNGWTILEEIPRMLIKVRKLSAICPFASSLQRGVNTKICEICRQYISFFFPSQKTMRKNATAHLVSERQWMLLWRMWSTQIVTHSELCLKVRIEIMKAWISRILGQYLTSVFANVSLLMISLSKQKIRKKILKRYINDLHLFGTHRIWTFELKWQNFKNHKWKRSNPINCQVILDSIAGQNIW